MEEVAKSNFQEDFFSRLAVGIIQIPHPEKEVGIRTYCLIHSRKKSTRITSKKIRT